MAITVFCLSAAWLIWNYGYGPDTENSHHTNRAYRQWKSGKGNYDPALVLRFLSADRKFKSSLRGKTKQEVQQWFPDLRPPDRANAHQRPYNQYIKDKEFFWIGDSAWGIEFVNGKVKEFLILKG